VEREYFKARLSADEVRSLTHAISRSIRAVEAAIEQQAKAGDGPRR
jgi:hypothetical protein